MATFNENKSIYLQIADIICDRILMRELRVDDRVPSVRETAAELEVNNNTVMRAYEHLQRKGIIAPHRGMGYYVCMGAEAFIGIARKKELLEKTIPKIAKEALSLNISRDEIIKAFDSYNSGYKITTL